MTDGRGSAVKKKGRLSAVSIDDDSNDAEVFVQQIKLAGVDVTTRSSVEKADLEATRDSEIIALDVRIGRVNYKSIIAAKKLKEQNPFRAIFFFTQVPEEVKVMPVNFMLVKHTSAAKLLSSIPLMILVHDVCMALLGQMLRVFEATDRQVMKRVSSSLLTHLNYFYDLLPPIVRSAEKSDSFLARRYREFREDLSPFIENPEIFHDSRISKLSAFRHLLIDNVTRELGELEKIEGVRIRPTLKEEIRSLKALQATVPVLEPSTADTGTVDTTVIETQDNENTEPANLYLNVWFPDRPAEEQWLIVMQAARLLVNLGSERESGPLAASDSIREETEALLDTLDHVDVMILCVDADVIPLSSRIEVPPRRLTTAEFQITPLRPGSIPLTVVLLVKNDPIHRSHFYFEAREFKSTDDLAT